MRIVGYFVVLMLFTSVSYALEVKGLYKANQAVATQSAEERKAAIRQAINQVVQKVSGRRDVITHMPLQSALSNVDAYVEQFQYTRSENEEGPMQLEITFQKAAIDRVLKQFNIPVWGANRPALAVWMAVDNGSQRYLVGENANKTSALFQQAAFEAGLPIVLPIMDLEDQRAVTFNDVWGMFGDRVVQASDRYGAKQVLFGRLLKEPDGGWQVRWALVNANSRFEGEGRHALLSRALKESLVVSAERLADIYAPKGHANISEVSVRVSGIAGLDDFARVSKHLSSLDVVSNIRWQRVQADKASFVLGLKGDAITLKQQIALNNVLEETLAITPVTPSQPQGELHKGQVTSPYRPQVLYFRVR